ncbi:MAG: deoxyribodipyrimidine photo-lyase [Micrococcus sp.]|nr:deoxyribodipyrimidine photo-lyase [Micrococcus sp.]
MTTLLWLRDDLRLLDHEALTAACDDGGDVVALWIREEIPGGEPDEDTEELDDVPDAQDLDLDDAATHSRRLGPRPLGAATRWWYHRSLEELSERLHEELGIRLVFARGDARQIVPALAAALEAETVRWSRRYAPGARVLDAQVKAALSAAGCEAHSHTGALLVEPWAVQTGAGSHYKVFTPFHKAAAQHDVGPTLPVPEAPTSTEADGVGKALEAARESGLICELAELELLDTRPEWWRTTIAEHWEPGERAAAAQLEDLDVALGGYQDDRDIPGDRESTSGMSPRLRSGEISPRSLWHAARSSSVADADRAAWIRQLYWREFSWHVTYHEPDLDVRPLRGEYAAFPYEPDEKAQRAWQRGHTGIHLVDAGMRQLWLSGWMHNRVRMAVASLFTKNLLQPWWDGEAWFWDTLVDADEANNPVSWQWVAGSGADASPYFRIFNPDTQAKKFDPDAVYVTRWLPEAQDPGSEYPHDPLVDLRESRAAALEAYEEVKAAKGD